MSSKLEKETVINLIRSLPDDGLISIGIGENQTTLNKDDLINHIIKNDDIGEKIVDVYMNYLRSFKELSK